MAVSLKPQAWSVNRQETKTMKTTYIKKLFAIAGFAIVAGSFHSNAIAQQKNDPKFNKMMQDSFKAEGIAGLDRIDQDATQKFCSDPKFANSKQGEAMRDKIQKINMDSISFAAPSLRGACPRGFPKSWAVPEIGATTGQGADATVGSSSAPLIGKGTADFQTLPPR